MEAESPEAVGAITSVAFDLPVGDPAAAPSKEVNVPPRIRRRFLGARSGAHTPSSLEEIEAKLREADGRRQQFHEWVSTKARLKPRNPLWSYQEEHISQRLEAKLYAAEQKRLSLLEKARMRLAKLDELRQAAKTGVEIRYEKEREELGTRVESRVQQAEANRMRLLKDHMQKRAAAQERTAISLKQRLARENRYKERIQSAIFQKRVAAEKKRMRLLEEEKTRAHARVMQVRRVAKTVYSQRENERRRMRERLENRLQRAKQRRAEYLRRRGSPHSSGYTIWNKHGDHLSRKLARCWRQFVTSRRTTSDLVKSYATLGVNEKSAKSMPFEQLTQLMESTTTLQIVNALLKRLELRFSLSQLSSSSIPGNLDHLLKHVSSPSKRKSPGRGTRTTRRVTVKESSSEPKSSEANKPSRYSVRVLLCAYMIVGHPNAVFSGQGEREAALKESAASFVRELDLLMKILLDDRSLRKSSPDHTSDGCGHHQELSHQLPSQCSFRSQLSTFDTAWCAYLHSFVVWKVKDARSLEDVLVTTACQLELSMMRTCKLTSDRQTCEVTQDLRAIQKQVTEDQKLLQDKVQHLSGSAGIERLESALSVTRSKFFEEREKRTPVLDRVTELSAQSSPSPSSSSVQPLKTVSKEHTSKNWGKLNHMAHSLSSSASSFPPAFALKSQGLDAQSSNTKGKQLPSENEFLVNEIVHGAQSMLVDPGRTNIKAMVKETLEKVFWEEVMDSMKEDSPNYSRILDLVKEVRDELCGMSPQNWKQEILDSIDIDILSQLLKPDIQDMDYLARILKYALLMLQKLSAPAKEIEMKKAHDKLLKELTYISHSYNEGKHSFILAVVRGLRFVLEEIQKLKTEISKARVQMLEPIIKGSAGLEYLQKAFADRYGPAPGAANSLLLTAQWISSLRIISEEEWAEHNDSVPVKSTSHVLPTCSALRTGRSGIALAQNNSSQHEIGDEDQPECNGGKLDLLLRIGVLKLASGIEGLTIQAVPETLELNLLRLRSVQSQLQQIIVISTSMLVLRQILVDENSALSSSDVVDSTISDSLERLVELLETVPDVGIEEIIDTVVAGSSLERKLQIRKDTISRLLTKSLQSNDAVFMKVSHSVYLAARAVVLGGTGDKGRKLAEATLGRVGAAMLLDQVVKAAKILIVVATVSGIVHAPWYRSLV